MIGKFLNQANIYTTVNQFRNKHSFEDTLGIFFSQIVPFTDYPEGTWMFYFNDNVFFWNGEY